MKEASAQKAGNQPEKMVACGKALALIDSSQGAHSETQQAVLAIAVLEKAVCCGEKRPGAEHACQRIAMLSEAFVHAQGPDMLPGLALRQGKGAVAGRIASAAASEAERCLKVGNASLEPAQTVCKTAFIVGMHDIIAAPDKEWLALIVVTGKLPGKVLGKKDRPLVIPDKDKRLGILGVCCVAQGPRRCGKAIHNNFAMQNKLRQKLVFFGLLGSIKKRCPVTAVFLGKIERIVGVLHEIRGFARSLDHF